MADEARRPSLQLRQAQVLALAGDHRRAAAVARDLATGREPSSDDLDTLARILALASAAAKGDAPAADDYARQSVALLRRAHAAGQYRAAGAAEQMRRDADFAALRDRDDFAAFLRELDKKQ